MQLNKSALVVQQNNFITTINAYIVYDIDNWPRNWLNNSLLKIACLEQLT